MTITFNGRRALWLMAWIVLWVGGICIAGEVSAASRRGYFGGILIGFSGVPWVIFVLFHRIRRRAP